MQEIFPVFWYLLRVDTSILNVNVDTLQLAPFTGSFAKKCQITNWNELIWFRDRLLSYPWTSFGIISSVKFNSTVQIKHLALLLRKSKLL